MPLKANQAYHKISLPDDPEFEFKRKDALGNDIQKAKTYSFKLPNVNSAFRGKKFTLDGAEYKASIRRPNKASDDIIVSFKGTNAKGDTVELSTIGIQVGNAGYFNEAGKNLFADFGIKLTKVSKLGESSKKTSRVGKILESIQVLKESKSTVTVVEVNNEQVVEFGDLKYFTGADADDLPNDVILDKENFGSVKKASDFVSLCFHWIQQTGGDLTYKGKSIEAVDVKDTAGLGISLSTDVKYGNKLVKLGSLIKESYGSQY